MDRVIEYHEMDVLPLTPEQQASMDYMLRGSAEVIDSMVRDTLRANPRLTVDDLLLQYWPDGSHTIIERTPAMKWADWQSDNHGWGS